MHFIRLFAISVVALLASTTAQDATEEEVEMASVSDVAEESPSEEVSAAQALVGAAEEEESVVENAAGEQAAAAEIHEAEAAVEEPPVETPPPVAQRQSPRETASSHSTPPARRLQDESDIQPAHLCKVETEEALKILTDGGGKKVQWSYGAWVYSSLSERAVKNGVAECKLMCDADEFCARWVYSCETKTCRYHDFGGMPHDEDNKYTFMGECSDNGAKWAAHEAKRLEAEKAIADAAEAGRLQIEADKLAEQNAAARAKAAVEAAQAMAAEQNNRRLAAAKKAQEASLSRGSTLVGEL